MDAFSDENLREIWVMSSAQVGKTEILNNVLGFHIHHDPSPILLVQPTLEMAEAWSKDRLAPMIRDTPALRYKIEDPKSRNSGNTLLHKKFTGGHLTVSGANSPASLASRPIRIVLFDEVDRYPASAGTEGDPVSLGRKRSQTFWNRKMGAVSTPTIKGASRIEAGFESGDQRLFMVPCPHCTAANGGAPDGFQRLLFPNVKWDEGQPETAQYACGHCGALIEHRQKQWMLSNGKWVSQKPFSGVASFHISELYSPWSTWAEMAKAFLEAKKLPQTLQTFVNTALAETWEMSGNDIEPQGLLARKEAYTAASIPPGVLAITAGVDTQDDRLELQIVGWGIDEECWPIDYVVLRGDPAQSDVWTELDQQRARKFSTDDGRVLGIESVAVDSGGHAAQQVYRYGVKHKAQRVWAIKGNGGQGRLVWPRAASRTAKSRAPVYIVGVDAAKEVLYSRLAKVHKPGPGYVHFPAWVEEEYLRQLTSEKRVIVTLNGHRVAKWLQKASNTRQEAQDTWVYAYAALHGRADGRAIDFLAKRKQGIEAAASRHMPVLPPTEQTIAQATQQGVKRQLMSAVRRKGFANNW